jgi:valyl-tRNA synthetase
MPFVTEELWQYVREPDEGLLAGVARTPTDASAIDPLAEAQIERVIGATQAIRSWRDEVGVKPGTTLAARLDAEGYDDLAPLLARIARLELRDAGVERDGGVGADGGAGTDGAGVASVPIPGGALAILEGVDLSAHAERIERERRRLDGEIERLERKLANAAFVANAPAELVAAEREKLARLRVEREAL